MKIKTEGLKAEVGWIRVQCRCRETRRIAGLTFDAATGGMSMPVYFTAETGYESQFTRIRRRARLG